MEWINFLDSIAVKHELTVDQRKTLIARLDRSNDDKTNIRVAVDLNISEPEIKDRLNEIYKIFAPTCPSLANLRGRGKLEALRACLWQQYERQKFQPTQPASVGIPNNIPLSGSPDFVGREDDLEWLQTAIWESTSQAIIIALAGMGGVGKTELAIQYARQHINDYLGGVCWIFAGEFEIAPQIVSFAVSQLTLNIPEGLDLLEQLNFCWRHWREGDVLLVLDDVGSYTQIQTCLPPDPRFKILLTTRQIMQMPVRSRSLEVLTQTAAIELLESEDLVGQVRLEEERRVAETLCDWLGYLPLGIELVGRYLHQEPDLSLSNMLFNLQHRALSEESLIRDPEDENWSLTAQRGVAAAFELSWEKLKEDPKRLGRLLGLFALAPIPWKLVESAEKYRCDLFPQDSVFNPDNLRKARRELIGLHLLKQIETDNYLLHSLIRKFFQQKLEEVDNANN
jgi:hypothetical protein